MEQLENTEQLQETKEPKRVGRPSNYSQEIADVICGRLAEGESLRTVCKDEEMPSTSSVFRWLREHEEFRNQYARAKEESADALVDEILDIADDGRNDWMEIETRGGGSFMKVDQEAVQRSKLRVDTRKWIASKMKPKKYGEKLDVTSGGEKVTVQLISFDSIKPNTDGNGTAPA